jgi:hypothetical protein
MRVDRLRPQGCLGYRRHLDTSSHLPMVMVEATEDRERHDLSARGRVVRRSWNGNALIEPLMRPTRVEVGDVLSENRAKVLFSEYDDVVEAFPPNAAEESLAGGVGFTNRSAYGEQFGICAGIGTHSTPLDFIKAVQAVVKSGSGSWMR